MHTIDQAYENFIEFKNNFESYKNVDLTESDTRSKILDLLLINVLGWTERDIIREGHTHEGYYDYLISVPSFKFVVEAKKSLNEFKLPKNHKTSSINALRKENLEVFNQIRYYLLEVGLQHGIISNGHQFIISKFLNSDGSDWTKNKCLIFNSMDDINNRFIEFYNCLSKQSVIENASFDFLKESDQTYQIISSTLPERDVELIRNSFSSNITPIINEVFGEIYKYDILDNKTLIENCFVENKEIQKNKLDIERLFADRPPRLTEVIPARNTSSLSSQIKGEMESTPISLKNIEAPKPIIVVGSKGAGKTTFINYLFKLSFDEKFLKSRPYVYVDFRKYTDEDLERVNTLILKDILNDLYEFYPEYELHSLKVLKRIYLTEIKRKEEAGWDRYKENNSEKYYENLITFLEESQKDIESHFIKLSEYVIRERALRLSLIIDNADQFNIEVQRRAFLFAQSINRKAKCAVIISLREGYYYTWRNRPPFDAFNSNVYHITAPPYQDVLQLRIDYALENFTLEGKTTGSIQNNYRLELQNTSIKEFFLGIKDTLFDQDNSEVLQFLRQTTYPNIREGLEIFNLFLLSGHTNVEEYILRHRFNSGSSSEYNRKVIIPIWEFVKVVGLGNKKYYNHLTSKIHNIFFPPEGSGSHFIKLKILHYLNDKLNTSGYQEKYVSGEEIITSFMNLNYRKSVIINAMRELFSFDLIETEDSLTDKEHENDLKTSSNVSISLKGNYYLLRLIPTFHYLDLILQDTPIFDRDFYGRIRSAFPLSDDKGKRNLHGRKVSTEKFIEYLQYQERKEASTNSSTSANLVENMMSNGLSDQIARLNR